MTIAQALIATWQWLDHEPSPPTAETEPEIEDPLGDAGIAFEFNEEETKQ
jgi:hypothetical protein